VLSWFFTRTGPAVATSSSPPLQPGSLDEIDPNPGPFERFDGCRLVEDRGNDGDSFHVGLPGGRIEQFRLYYVDCPETAFRTYPNGETNHERIAHQARYFLITPEQAVEAGRAGEEHALQALRRPFTLFTRWDDPYGDSRYHALVQLSDGHWLHAGLVASGLARIYTKPADLPDGTTVAEHLRFLVKLENGARAAHRGAWRYEKR